MGAFFVYILKSAVCLSVFYLFYRLLLSRETFHRFNRIAVLGILVISLLIPFCEVKVAEQNEVHQTVLSLEQLLLLADMMEDAPVVQTQTGKTTVWVHILLFVYLAGILFFTCRNIYSLSRLLLLLRSGKREKLDKNITLVVHNKKDVAPFSWMRYVVISQQDLEENGREILIHELAHIRKRHSIDLLIADICIFFQWFNPAAWLLKQELQNIHEYEADETVIKEGVNAKEYQLLLIKKAVGTRLYSMANSFNHSKLKKRITMMLKEKSSPWARLKYLYVLPLAAIAVSAFARPEISNELKEISEIKVNDLTAIVETNKVESISERADSTIIHGTYLFIEETPVVKNEEDGASSTYTTSTGNTYIKVEDLAAVQPNTEETNRETLRPVGINLIENRANEKANENYNPGQMLLAAAQIKPQQPQDIKIRGIKMHGMKDGKQPLYIIDGKEATEVNLQAISPDHIESVTVLKDQVAMDLYGEKAVNGVVLITLFTEEERAERAKRPEPSLLEMAQNKVSPEPLYLLDGNILSNISVINPDKIAEIIVYKADDKNNKESVTLLEKYGDKASNGIISIISKKPGDTKGTILREAETVRTIKTIKMQGQVIDTDGNPIIGAVIKVAGSNVGTVSDREGKFSLEAHEMDYITVVFIGMKKAVAKVSPKLTVTLEADPE